MWLTPLNFRTAGGLGLGLGVRFTGGGDVEPTTTATCLGSAATDENTVDSAMNVIRWTPDWFAAGVQVSVAPAGLPGRLSSAAPAGSPRPAMRTFSTGPPVADAAS